ncbi:hypothetical protein L0244_20350 [bacterium]|nr:hypothetical protein [bacterium]MCI0615351.1 hypothetical protein [bacterium]
MKQLEIGRSKENMKRLPVLLISLFLIAFCEITADAWVGGGGAYNGAAVGPRGGSVYGPNGGAVQARPYGGCCYSGYSGYDIAAPSTASPSGGAASAQYDVTKAADPNTPFFVAPAPAGPTVPIGTIVYSLPKGCVSTVTNGTFYNQCGSTYYRNVYQAGTLVYEVVKAPY